MFAWKRCHWFHNGQPLMHSDFRELDKFLSIIIMLNWQVRYVPLFVSSLWGCFPASQSVIRKQSLPQNLITEASSIIEFDDMLKVSWQQLCLFHTKMSILEIEFSISILLAVSWEFIDIVFRFRTFSSL